MYFISHISYSFRLIAPILIWANATQSEDTKPLKIPQPLEIHLTEELVSIFEPGELVLPEGGQYSSIEYRLFRPVTKSGHQDASFPLIVFLNGHGKEQMNYGNLGQLKHLQSIIFHEPEHPEKYPFYLLAVRTPVDENNHERSWFDSSPSDLQKGMVEPIEAAIKVVDKLVKDYAIDENRILLLGISSGGTACWELAMRYPNRFAAVVPTASIGGDESRVDRIRNVPVWAFHSEGNDPEAVRQTVQRLQEAGGNARLTLIRSDRHACWDEAFENYDLLDWMLAQNLDDPGSSWPSQWHKSATWQVFKYTLSTPAVWWRTWNNIWPPALPILAVLLLVSLGRRELRSRSKRAIITAASQTESEVQNEISTDS